MISQELLQGFISEASDLLDDIEPALVSYPKTKDDPEREEVVNRVFRHFHSIKGSAGFVGLHDIARLTHEAETLLEKYRNRPGTPIPLGTITLLCRTVDFLRMMFQDQNAVGKHDESDNVGADTAEYESLIKDISGAIRETLGSEPAKHGHHDTTVQISLSRGKKTKNETDGSDGSTKIRSRSNTRVMGPEFNALEKQEPAPPPPAKSPPTARSTRTKVKDPKEEREPTSSHTKVKKSDTVRIIRAGSKDAMEKLPKSEFLARFLAEANELLEQTEQALLQAEQHPELGGEPVQEALRCLHSFKGNSGFMGIKDLERLSHRMETEIENTIGKAVGLDAHTFDIMLHMIDVLRQSVLDLGYGGSGEIPEVDTYIAMMDDANTNLGTSTRARNATKISGLGKTTEAREATRLADTPQTTVVEEGKEPGTKQITRVLGSAARGSLRHEVTDTPNADPTDTENTRLMPLGRPSQQEDLSSAQRQARINIRDDFVPPPETKRAPDHDTTVQTPPVKETGDHVRTTTPSPGEDPGKRKRVSGQRIAVTPRNDIRVDLNKLDLMLDLVGELVIAETMVTRHPAVVDQENESLERAVHQLRRVANSLQDMAMSVRMIPLVSTFRRMIRLIYDLSMKAGKMVDLILLGEETEVDRTVIERISDPLVHIIRNAIDHGIESPEERRLLDKPETGRVTIEGRHEGGEVWIVVTDDGRGLNRDVILKKAIERGLINGDGSDLTDHQVYHLVFEPGFSTASEVTDISGRGFGMDVVRKNIEKLSGKIDIRTREGEGTAVIMRIPLTLAIIEGMLVRAGDTRYIIPLLSIRESLKPDPEQIMHTPDGQALIKLRNELIPVLKLDEVFRRVKVTKSMEEGILMVVEGEDGGVVALFADELLGQQETVIKGLSGWLKKSRGVSGCTILGDGEVGLILDIGAIVRLAGRAAAY